VEQAIEPEVNAFSVEAGDAYLLCSDGLCGVISDEAIQQLLSTYAPSRACLALVDAANEAGGKDNITALVLRVDGVG
jgi:protein phosphatase